MDSQKERSLNNYLKLKIALAKQASDHLDSPNASDTCIGEWASPNFLHCLHLINLKLIVHR